MCGRCCRHHSITRVAANVGADLKHKAIDDSLNTKLLMIPCGEIKESHDQLIATIALVSNIYSQPFPVVWKWIKYNMYLRIALQLVRKETVILYNRRHESTWLIMCAQWVSLHGLIFILYAQGRNSAFDQF